LFKTHAKQCKDAIKTNTTGSAEMTWLYSQEYCNRTLSDFCKNCQAV